MPSPTCAISASPLNAVRAMKNVFARQGTIVASYRTYNGRKLGPYYRLAYRAEGRQRSIYLGKSKKILRQVRRLLEKLQQPLKTRRVLRHTHKAIDDSVKKQMAQFRLDMLKVGLQIRGYAIHGWRRFRALHRIGCHTAFTCTPHAPREGYGILRKLSVPLHPIDLTSPTASPPPPMTAPNSPNCTFFVPVDQKEPAINGRSAICCET